MPEPPNSPPDPELMAIIVEHALVGVLVAQDHVFRYVNPAASEITGYAAQELMAWGPEGYARLIHPDDRELVLGQAQKRQAGHGDVTPRYRWRLVTKSGETKWVETLSQTVLVGGRAADLVAMLDVTEQQALEAKLATANHMFRMVLDTIPVRVFWKDRQSRYLGCNTSFARDAGEANPGALLGKTDFEMGWRDQAELYRADDAKVMNTGEAKVDYEETQTTPSGDTIWLRTSKVPLLDPKENVVGVLGTYQDVTAQLALKEQLRRSQKMDAVGQLAGGVAHDFNNMLAGIQGYAELLANALQNDPTLGRYAERILAATERSAALTQKLLAFSRKGKLVSKPVDVNRVLVDAIELLERTIDRKITVELRPSAVPVVVEGDPAQLQSVLLNLGLNARDSMGAGGRLVFETAVEELDRTLAGRCSIKVEPGTYVRISVVDTGSGIAPEILDRIFEPFFTTKEVGEGTGLGLAAVYGAVHEHRGTLRVESAVGEGTAFHVFLPLSQQEVMVPVSSRRALRGHGTVLIVDDEELVRGMCARMLTTLGYEVELAPDGQAALQLFRAAPERFDAVLLDVVMPRMDGNETFTALKRIRPDVRVVVVSGYSQENVLPALLEQGAVAFLQKPFSLASLTSAIAKALARRP